MSGERAWTTIANFLILFFKFIAVFQIQFRDCFDNDKQTKSQYREFRR